MSTPESPSAFQMATRTALTLLLFVAAFSALLAGAYHWTKPAIAAAIAEEKIKRIDEVLPRSRYDNDLLNDAVTLEAPELGLGEPARILRARKAGQIQALVFETIAPDGFAGNIRLLIALAPDGRILGVRVTEHKETPGLGDYIEARKDRNKERPWITQFNGLNPVTIKASDWQVKKDGGRFDSMAGATVSPRAVIKAIRRAALFIAARRDQILPPDEKGSS